MDLKLIGTTFVAVFLAELGDKTQLATLTFAASGQSRWSVFIGSAAALVATSAIAVLVGEALARVISPTLLKRLAGVAFVLIGAWVLWSSRPSA
ncbi:TMEM165/GDT1 family protein [Hyalangium sp.]|uniref:TMEM165/GDT1 family protein n=1 Tax=Hyalangium sp. TaxID=2028555 RepID=UPI002D3973C1|nr:TMEM165/GDT1 family protein [Hyalangium sp.]HYH99512.1 TMEM165/GDT1 family protein [Hyalangium sp.]